MARARQLINDGASCGGNHDDESSYGAKHTGNGNGRHISLSRAAVLARRLALHLITDKHAAVK